MNELRNYLRTSFNKSVLFDTGVILDFLVGDKRAKAFFEEFVFPGQLTPVISVQTASELFMAARDKGEETDLDHWLSSVFDITPISYDISKHAGLLKRGKGLSASGAVLAATSVALRIPLATNSPEAYKKANIRAFKPYT